MITFLNGVDRFSTIRDPVSTVFFSIFSLMPLYALFSADTPARHHLKRDQHYDGRLFGEKMIDNVSESSSCLLSGKLYVNFCIEKSLVVLKFQANSTRENKMQLSCKSSCPFGLSNSFSNADIICDEAPTTSQKTISALGNAEEMTNGPAGGNGRVRCARLERCTIALMYATDTTSNHNLTRSSCADVSVCLFI